MLTIDEIKNISFRKATLNGGYRAEDVDSFIDEVIVSFEQLKKEKTNLVHKIDVLATRVEQYRADEETVRNALLASQKVADACVREAKEKAARILRDAENKAQAIVADANDRAVAEKERYVSLQADAAELRNELIALYGKHIKSIDDLPSASDVEASAEELDRKYPTEDMSAQPIEDDVKIAMPARQPIQPAQRQQLRTAPQTMPAYEDEYDEQISEPDAAPVQAPAHAKRQSKFSHLKFGENYDVNAD